MDRLRAYVLSIICAALICSIIRCVSGKTAKAAAIIKILCGAFLIITILSPIIDFDIPEYGTYIQNTHETATRISQDGSSAARNQMTGIIKAEARAYILEKADSLNMNIDVEVNLDDENYIPTSIVIMGRVSPYEKAVLSEYICRTLDIPEEHQQWKNR